MRVNVTRRDIELDYKQSQPFSSSLSSRCAIAQALKRRLPPGTHVWVSLGTVNIEGLDEIPLPPKAIEFIFNNDKLRSLNTDWHLEMKPFSFEL